MRSLTGCDPQSQPGAQGPVQSDQGPGGRGTLSWRPGITPGGPRHMLSSSPRWEVKGLILLRVFLTGDSLQSLEETDPGPDIRPLAGHPPLPQPQGRQHELRRLEELHPSQSVPPWEVRQDSKWEAWQTLLVSWPHLSGITINRTSSSGGQSTRTSLWGRNRKSPEAKRARLSVFLSSSVRNVTITIHLQCTVLQVKNSILYLIFLYFKFFVARPTQSVSYSQ